MTRGKPEVFDTVSFIAKAPEIHGDKYDYSLVVYVKSILKVKIICPKHGIFEQSPNAHLAGKGCKECGNIEIHRTQGHVVNTETFILKALEIHGDRYDYSLAVYVHTQEKVKIICREHGVFKQTPNRHLAGTNCPMCAWNNQIKTPEEFIEECIEVHDGYYDYSLTEYTYREAYITIICPEHGAFEQRARHHRSGSGCPKCGKIRSRESKASLYVKQFLEDKGLDYEQEFDIPSPFSNQWMSYDFRLLDHAVLVEVDGAQHRRGWGGKQSNLERKQRNDGYKNDWADENGFDLKRIDDSLDLDQQLHELMEMIYGT